MSPRVTPSIRAQILDRRTYCRPLSEDGSETGFETREQQVDRIIGHQRWLWERAKGGMTREGDRETPWVLVPLNKKEEAELDYLSGLLINMEVSMAGRTHWLGGTEISKKREASMFNCSFLEVRTSSDVVDALWLLLQGCGVGFRPVTGTLNGFMHKAKIEVIRSTRTGKGGQEETTEHYDNKTKEYTIVIGDSAKGWARAAGKLIGKKYPAKKVIIDLSQIRPGGERLKGYGWISSGDAQISVAFPAIAEIMSEAHGRLLTRIEIIDIMNHLGTILSSRRSAEIALMEYREDEWYEFAMMKKDCFKNGESQRMQSNNSLLFREKPSLGEIQSILDIMIAAGGSEPGMVNMTEALRRAPWFRGLNPCAEILLASKGFCNLVETVLSRYNGKFKKLLKDHRILARANYRQTCVDLRDGVLQNDWNEVNDHLHLCGVGVTGVTGWEYSTSAMHWSLLRDAAHEGCHSMADELGMPRSKAITTAKPSGSRSKTCGTVEYGEVPEGMHNPLGRHIFNWVEFSTHDEMLPTLRAANYENKESPYKVDTLIVKLPVEYPASLGFKEFTLSNGMRVEVIEETAIEQLDRYKMMMDNYIDHNVSSTISYDPSEIKGIAKWIHGNWGSYVATSFLFRNDATKTAEDLGYPYLPQQVVDKATYDAYTASLGVVDLANLTSEFLEGSDCEGGACPIR